jgi:hypothetical protein
MTYYTPNQTSTSKNEAYIYASFIVVSSFLYVVTGHCYAFGLAHLGMKIRVACSSLIYRKSLKLSQSVLAEGGVGQMVNLLSNDVGRFDVALSNVHFLWMGPLETLVILGSCTGCWGPQLWSESEFFWLLYHCRVTHSNVKALNLHKEKFDSSVLS